MVVVTDKTVIKQVLKCLKYRHLILYQTGFGMPLIQKLKQELILFSSQRRMETELRI